MVQKGLRSIEAAKKICPNKVFYSKLKYYELQYVCSRSGSCRTGATTGATPNQSTSKASCPFPIKTKQAHLQVLDISRIFLNIVSVDLDQAAYLPFYYSDFDNPSVYIRIGLRLGYMHGRPCIQEQYCGQAICTDVHAYSHVLFLWGEGQKVKVDNKKQQF